MRVTFIFCILAFLFACKTSNNKKPFPKPKFRAEHGFYHWQTSWNGEKRDSLFEQLKVKYIYMRMFDVDWNSETNQVEPISAIDFQGDINQVYSIESFVPVIYITNQTFKHLSDSAAKNLATQIYQKLRIIFFTAEKQQIENRKNDFYEENYYHEYHSEGNPYFMRTKDIEVAKIYNIDSLIESRMAKFTEIQFDCDWTPSTKVKYFKFLTACRKKFVGKTISATIRLYPYKFPEKMGVPPVDRGMLMCYNVGDVKNPSSDNSIFDLEEIRKYIGKELKYPLELDYALPIFSWAAVYHKNKLVNVISPNIVKNTENFKLKRDQPKDSSIRYYEVFADYSTYDMTFHKGDIVKLERINYGDLKELAAELGFKNRNKIPRVILYRLDEQQLIENHKDVQAIFNTF